MGPLGILVGSVAGGLTSYTLAKGSFHLMTLNIALYINDCCFLLLLGTFKSAAVVIRDELTDEQREKLCDHITEAFRNFGPQDLMMLIPLLTSSVQFQKVVITHLIQFFTNELRMQIID